MISQHRRKYGLKRKIDYENRTHVCGCGKSYFSYIGLLLHRKNKHEENVTDLNIKSPYRVPVPIKKKKK